MKEPFENCLYLNLIHRWIRGKALGKKERRSFQWMNEKVVRWCWCWRDVGWGLWSETSWRGKILKELIKHQKGPFRHHFRKFPASCLRHKICQCQSTHELIFFPLLCYVITKFVTVSQFHYKISMKILLHEWALYGCKRGTDRQRLTAFQAQTLFYYYY